MTRSGEPVAELRPVRPRGLDAATLLSRWRHLPPLDPEAFRKGIDHALDPDL